MLRGVLSGGTSGTAAFYLPEGLRPRRDTVRLPVALTDRYGYIEIATTGAVTPYTVNLQPGYTLGHVAALWGESYPGDGTYYGWPAGNGAWVAKPAGWAVLSAPAVTGYTREYRISAHYTYLPAGGTTDSNISIRVQDASTAGPSIGPYTPSPIGSNGEYDKVGSWASNTFLDGKDGTGIYPAAIGNWTTATGNYYIEYVRLDVRYVPSTSYFYLDGLNFHTAI